MRSFIAFSIPCTMADMVTRLTMPSTTPRIVSNERNQWAAISRRPMVMMLSRIMADQS